MLENESGDIVAMDEPNEIESVELEQVETPVEEKEQPEGEVKRKRPSGFHRKISKLEQQLAERDARLAELEKKAIPQSEKPIIDNFDSFENFQEALVDWTVDKREQDREKRAKQQEEQKVNQVRYSERLTEWEKKEETLGDDLDEYEELVAQHSKTSFRQDLLNATAESDVGPQIRLYLLRNPDELAKLNKPPSEISAFTIHKKIAELEAKLSKPPVNKVSKSAEPITPVRGTSKTGVNLDKITDTDQWIAHRYPSLYGKK